MVFHRDHYPEVPALGPSLGRRFDVQFHPFRRLQDHLAVTQPLLRSCKQSSITRRPGGGEVYAAMTRIWSEIQFANYVIAFARLEDRTGTGGYEEAQRRKCHARTKRIVFIGGCYSKDTFEECEIVILENIAFVSFNLTAT